MIHDAVPLPADARRWCGCPETLWVLDAAASDGAWDRRVLGISEPGDYHLALPGVGGGVHVWDGTRWFVFPRPTSPPPQPEGRALIHRGNEDRS